MDTDKTAQALAAIITGASIISLIAWFVVGLLSLLGVI